MRYLEWRTGFWARRKDNVSPLFLPESWSCCQIIKFTPINIFHSNKFRDYIFRNSFPSLIMKFCRLSLQEDRKNIFPFYIKLLRRRRRRTCSFIPKSPYKPRGWTQNGVNLNLFILQEYVNFIFIFIFIFRSTNNRTAANENELH